MTSQRHYAAGKPIPNPKRRLVRTGPPGSAPSATPAAQPQQSKGTTGRVVVECPPLEFFESACKRWNLKETLPELYWQACSLYIQAYAPSRLGWEKELIENHPFITPALLHHLAIIFLRDGGSPSSATLTRRLFLSASSLGHVPSTLTMARFISQRDGTLSDDLRPLWTRFQRIVAEGRDANALVLQGMVLAKEGKNADAKAMFRKATALGDAKVADTEAEVRPVFVWGVDACIGMGRLLVREGNSEEAKAYFRRAVTLPPEGFGNALGHLELGRMLDGEGKETDEQLDERYGNLLAASYNGHGEAWSLLLGAELERKKRAETRGEIEAEKEYERWATEWGALAEPIQAK